MCGAIELDPGDKYSVSIVGSFEWIKKGVEGRKIDARAVLENLSLPLPF